MRIFLAIFILVPLLEIYLLIRVGRIIGGFETVGLVIATAVIGLALIRAQGRKALLSAQEKMAKGNVPATELAEGLFMAIGGVLLLTPGFATDFLGFCCLVPGLRRFLIVWVIGRWLQKGQVIQGQYSRNEGFVVRDSRFGKQDSHGGNVIEGESKREDD